MTTENMILWIRGYISQRGKCTHEAQSCWGITTYQWKGIIVGLGDDGYTSYITWGDRVQCSYTYGRQIKYRLGNDNEITILYNGLHNEA